MRLVSAIYDEFYPFHEMGIFDEFVHTIHPEALRAGDVLIVWGGADISPSLYNREIGPSQAGLIPSNRDRIEWDLMKRAEELNIPIIGICRGAQMLCALAGGFLVQHVDNHAGSNHFITTRDGKMLTINSAHHQMQYPFEVDHELIAWSTIPLSRRYLLEDKSITVEKEPEFVYYPKQKGFAVQWHPEWMPSNTPATQYVFNFIKERL